MQMALFQGYTPRPKLTIAGVIKICAQTRALGEEPPCEQTIINRIEAGDLEAVKPDQKWLVYEDSLMNYFKRLDSPAA